MSAMRAASRRSGRRPPRYSALALLRHGLSGRQWPRAWPDHPMRGRYDVVIIGGGVHGLAAAYYLAVNHGITDVAVLDKGYIGGGGSGRNTAILRSNYLTPEGVRFYDRSMQLYRTLAARPGLQRDVLPARAPHAGPQRLVAAHHALAGRGQPAAGRRLRGHRPSRDQEAGAVPGHLGAHALPDPWRALPPAGRDHPARRGRLGLRPGRSRPRRAHSSGHRGHRHRRRRRSGTRRAHQPRGHRHSGGAQLPRPAGPRWWPEWLGCGCPSRPSRCRPRSPSLSGRSSTPWWCRARCTCT